MNKITEEQIRERELNHNIRLVRVLSNVNTYALKTYYNIVYKEIPYESKYENGVTTIELPTTDLFKRAYGPLIVKFKGKNIIQNNLIDIQPKEYLEGCYRSMPIIYKGVAIPDTKKDRFKIDIASRLI